MKLSKPAAIAGVVALLVFVFSILYLYNREKDRVKKYIIAELAEKMRKEEAAKYEKERQAFAARIELKNAIIAAAGQKYNDEHTVAVNERAAKEAARQANASLNASWEIKFTNCNEAHRQTLIDWGASDGRIQKAHDEEIKGHVDKELELTGRIADLEKDQDAKSAKIIELTANLALAESKDHWLVAYFGGGLSYDALKNIQPSLQVGIGIKLKGLAKKPKWLRWL
jgi:hypothetical protein